MTANLIIGSSHTLYLAAAVGRYEASWQEASRDLVRIDSASGNDNHLLFTTNRPAFLELKADAAGKAVASFGPLVERIRSFDQPGSKVIFGIGGNEHNIRFLCAQPRPFDFIHPSWPGVLAGRQILPAREMVAILESLLRRTLAVTRLIAAELPRAELFYLAPPPPIPSERQIRANPAIFKFDAHGVEDAGVRLKIHSIYLETLAAFCAAHRIRFLPPPSQSRDERGFLREAYWDGATHANVDYYRPIVSELGL